MPLIRLVADMILELGSGTADTLMPRLSELGYNREQVLQALKNAKRKGYVITDGSGRGLGLAAYYPPKSPMRQIVGVMTKIPDMPLVSSVFELGAPKPAQSWPQTKGTVHAPLGPWNEKEMV